MVITVKSIHNCKLLQYTYSSNIDPKSSKDDLEERCFFPVLLHQELGDLQILLRHFYHDKTTNV